MTDWRVTTLGQVFAEGGGFIRTGPFGSQLHRSDHVDSSDGIPVVMPKDMNKGRIDATSVARIDQPTAKRLSQHLLVAGDILLSRRGDVGRSAWVAEHELPVLCGTGSMRLHTGVGGSIQSGYLRYVMRSRSVIRYLESQAVGATMPNLNAGIVSSLPITVPPQEHQRVVAEILASMDDRIENNRRRVEVLEEMARTIYREWFVHFRYPGHEGVPFVDSTLGPIPEGWEARPFSDVAMFVNGFAFKPTHWGDAGRPIIKIKELKQGVTSDTPWCNQHEVSETFWVASGDVLFSWSADLGVYRWSGESGLLNQHLFKVTPLAAVSSTFLFHSLAAAMPQFRDRAQGTTMRHIKRSALFEVMTSVPPENLCNEFTEAVEPAAQAIISLNQSSRWLATIRDLLLPKLVTGEIDVSTLNLDALLGETA